MRIHIQTGQRTSTLVTVLAFLALCGKLDIKKRKKRYHNTSENNIYQCLVAAVCDLTGKAAK